MASTTHLRRFIGGASCSLLSAALAITPGCSSSSPKEGNTDQPENDGGPGATPNGSAATSPFKSLEPAANAPQSFTQPRAGVPLPAASVAFLATIEGLTEEETVGAGERVGVLLQGSSAGAPTVLYSGDKLVNPFDIDVSLDGATLYIADPAAGADGKGAILTVPVTGGEPVEVVSGRAPRAVTIAADGAAYFSGVDDDTGIPAVFVLRGSVVTTLFAGPPLVDPSGLAVMGDGRVLVADTRLFDGASEGAAIGSEAGIVAIKDNQATILATGFSTGYPAGIALTTDEKNLIISGQGPDRSDTVYLVDMAHPEAAPTAVRDKFSVHQDSSAGLKRAHGENLFIWASLSMNGGTVYKIRGN